MAIKCCNGCVPPKRTGDCHATCHDYIIEAAFHNAERAIEYEREKASGEQYARRTERVQKALKRRKK